MGHYNYTSIHKKNNFAKFGIMDLNENPIGTRPTWHEYFMAKSIISSSRSSCRNVHAGSTIVEIETGIEIGAGYNGAAPGLENCLDTGCRKEAAGEEYGEKHGTGTCWGTHSEQNAASHLSKTSSSPFALYATIFPCNDCANNLLSYKSFQQLFFKSPYDEREAESTLIRLSARDVMISRLNLSPERMVDIILNEPKVKIGVWSPEEREKIHAKYLNK